MIKRIIVEGADQQGKTTLCRLLAKSLDWRIKHFGKPHDDFNFIADYIIPENTISDRNFLSEVVYSTINERQSRAQLNLLANIFRNKGTLLILVDRGEDFKFDDSRHEDYSEVQIREAVRMYRLVYDLAYMDKIILNPCDENFEKDVEDLILRINEDI